EGMPQTFDLTTYVSVPQGDSVTYTCADCEAWAKVTTAGSLTLSPKHPQVGDHTFHLTVTDPKNVTAQGPMLIHVKPNDNLKPVCTSPQTFTAHVGQSFTGSIVCTDPSGTTLTYSKMWDNDSPMWMTVSSVGTMSGTPGTPNVGADQYMVTVTNGNGQSTDVTVVINVLND